MPLQSGDPVYTSAEHPRAVIATNSTTYARLASCAIPTSARGSTLPRLRLGASSRSCSLACSFSAILIVCPGYRPDRRRWTARPLDAWVSVNNAI